MITLEDYIKLKYPDEITRVLNYAESKIIGISLKRDWYKNNKNLEISKESLKELYIILLKNEKTAQVKRVSEILFSNEMWDEQMLYLMRNEHGKFKVGISKDPFIRRNALRTSSGNGVELVAFWKVISAKYSEKFIHSQLRNKREIGEWFTHSSKDEISKLLGAQSFLVYEQCL